MSEWENWWGDEETSQWDGSSSTTYEEAALPSRRLPRTQESKSRQYENSSDTSAGR
ncbi:hypothetical protein [Niveibacterium sp. SC-1]|uniref:hypothetical protein n=1 Tax=Niveibacterium sp. SC-1 TaxID=3135646 RepID=UPI00311EC5AA